jgi:hypothetical protein
MGSFFSIFSSSNETEICKDGTCTICKDDVCTEEPDPASSSGSGDKKETNKTGTNTTCKNGTCTTCKNGTCTTTKNSGKTGSSRVHRTTTCENGVCTTDGFQDMSYHSDIPLLNISIFVGLIAYLVSQPSFRHILRRKGLTNDQCVIIHSLIIALGTYLGPRILFSRGGTQ